MKIALDHAHASIMNGLHICLMNTIMTPTIQLNQRHKAASLPRFPITSSNAIVYKPPVFLSKESDLEKATPDVSDWKLYTDYVF